MSLLEKICVCVARNEPVLLVGETGVGKTATINYLAKLAGEIYFTTDQGCLIVGVVL